MRWYVTVRVTGSRMFTATVVDPAGQVSVYQAIVTGTSRLREETFVRAAMAHAGPWPAADRSVRYVGRRVRGGRLWTATEQERTAHRVVT